MILKKERPTKRYRSIFERWLPRGEIEKYRRAYDTEFLSVRQITSDHGTTFNIYLPASEKEIIEEKKPAGDTLKGC